MTLASFVPIAVAWAYAVVTPTNLLLAVVPVGFLLSITDPIDRRIRADPDGLQRREPALLGTAILIVLLVVAGVFFESATVLLLSVPVAIVLVVAGWRERARLP